MNPGQIVLIVYAVLLLAGGIAGYRSAGSKASLYSGVGSAALLFLGWGLSLVSLVAGLWLGAIVTLLLCVAFALRLAKTRKMMPAGMLLLVSGLTLILLTHSALDAQGML